MSLLNTIKSRGKWGIALILTLLLGVGYALYEDWPKKQPPVVINPLTLEAVKQERDKNGKLYEVLEQKVYTQVQVNTMLDSVAKALKIKVKTIQGAERIVFETDTVYRDLPVKVIQVPDKQSIAYQVQRHDGWNDIVATAGPDSGSIIFRSRDTLTRIELYKHPLFGAPAHYVYLNNSNPFVRIDQGASFTIKEKQPWLTIGPYAGYDPFLGRASIGVGVMFPLITLKK